MLDKNSLNIKLSIVNTYKLIWNILRLCPMKKLIFILFTIRVIIFINFAFYQRPLHVKAPIDRSRLKHRHGSCGYEPKLTGSADKDPGNNRPLKILAINPLAMKLLNQIVSLPFLFSGLPRKIPESSFLGVFGRHFTYLGLSNHILKLS